MKMENAINPRLASWIARVTVGSVFVVNLACAASFILQPQHYVSAFELDGLPGKLVVQAFGILFLIWNATYPPVLLQPRLQMTLFGVILVQQAIGLAGETWLWWHLPSNHSALWSTGLRFIAFDGIGLIIMAVAYLLMRITCARKHPTRYPAPTGVHTQEILGH
jgi:hypothetical protein